MSIITPPYRAEHVGSLLRPPELRNARTAFHAGRIGRDELRAIEDACIRDAVAKQESIGLSVVTDGEYRRDWWHLDFLKGLDGIGLRPSTQLKFVGQEEVPPTPMVTGKIGYGKPVMLDHFKYLKSIAKKTAKFTIPAPSMAHLRGGSNAVPRHIYPSLEDYWYDLALAYRKAIRTLADAGCTYIQIDDVTFAYLADENIRAMCVRNGDDPDLLAKRFADTINLSLVDRPKNITIAMHTCRGNFKSTWAATAPYAKAATEAMFSTGVDAFFMEFESDRAGSFDILKLLPDYKQVVLGVVSSKIGALESKDEIKRRIDAAAKIVPLERLALSPQCGFASTHHGNNLAYDEQWRKLERVVEVAGEVWR